MKKKLFNLSFTLLMGLFSIAAFAQDSNRTITGNVQGSDGSVIPGVNIVEKGTQNGTVTDFDGDFTISVASGKTLVFSYVGMQKQEVVVGDSDQINVILAEDASNLDEVVVVGYGVQKRTQVTASVATIAPKDVEDLPVGNLGAALVGRVAGVSVSGGDARPGYGASITIRNPVTLAKDGGTTSPLYVIDGVIQFDPWTGTNDSSLFNSLDASEVESISFIKDASASIYGSRAAQGVVLVTTKKGKVGPTKFTYSGNYSIADKNYTTKMMSAYEFGRAVNIMNSQGGGRSYDPTSATPDHNYFFTPNELDHFKTLNYDFLGDNWTSAVTQRHNINATGGSENGTYFAGLSYYTQEGNLATLNYDKWSFRSGANINLAKGLKGDFTVSGYFVDRSTTFNKVNSENVEDDYYNLVNRYPFLPMYIAGNPVRIANGNREKLSGYHYEEIQRLNNLVTNKEANVSVNANVEYEVPFIDGLKIKASYAKQQSVGRGDQLGYTYDIYEYKGPTSDDPYIYYESGVGALGTNTIKTKTTTKNGDRVMITNTSSTREQLNGQISYAKEWGKHSLSALAAVEKSESVMFTDRLYKDGVPDWSNGMLWQATGATDNSYNWRNEYGDLGYIGRANYSYDDKYLLEFVFRSDASSKFAPQNYWGNFYSLSGGWVASKEDNFKSNTFDYLKLRASVGQLGKDDVKPYSYLMLYSYQVDKGAVFGGNGSVSPGLRPNSYANADIHWSNEVKTNFGIDTKMLDGKLSASLDVFYNTGTDILMNLNSGVPFTVGGATSPTNYGEINFWGSEISLNYSGKINEDLRFGVQFNTGFSDNKVIKGDFADISTLKPWDAKPGGPMDVGTWGYDYIGMFKTQDEITQYFADNNITSIMGKTVSNMRPGMLYYRDVRGAWDSATQTFGAPDGIVDSNDQILMKKRATGITGFSNVFNLNYKRLSMQAVVSTSWGGYRLVDSAMKTYMKNTDAINRIYENKPAVWANMYHETLNPSGTFPDMHKNNSSVNGVVSQFWHAKDLSIALRNVNIGYTMSKEMCDALNVSSLRFNLVALNPFNIINPYKSWGLPSYGTYDRYPQLSTYSFGVNVKF